MVTEVPERENQENQVKGFTIFHLQLFDPGTIFLLI